MPSGSETTATNGWVNPPVPYWATMASFASEESLPGRSNRVERASAAGPADAAHAYW